MDRRNKLRASLGAFLRILRKQYEAANDEDRERITRAARYGLAALENREEM